MFSTLQAYVMLYASADVCALTRGDGCLYKFNVINLTQISNATGVFTMVSTVLLTESGAGRKLSKYPTNLPPLCLLSCPLTKTVGKKLKGEHC